jgi:hypothetical protein
MPSTPQHGDENGRAVCSLRVIAALEIEGADHDQHNARVAAHACPHPPPSGCQTKELADPLRRRACRRGRASQRQSDRGRKRGTGAAASSRAAIPVSARPVPPPSSTRHVPTSRQLGPCSYRTERARISRLSEIIGIGLPTNIDALIAASACRMIGGCAPDRGHAIV